ncbi:MAG: DUF4845 domain-containing protein [Gammaproteobacteria bacterium]|nr:DUF4845 domain-containing protein [Gammaproteobacteria bacterium]
MINKFKSRQTGEGLTSLLFTLFFIGCVVLIALRVVPLYLEYFQVVSSLEGIAEEPETSKKSLKEIKKNLLRRMRDINDVERVNDEHITITKKKGLITISVDYEARVPMIANFDLIASFNKNVEISGAD